MTIDSSHPTGRSDKRARMRTRFATAAAAVSVTALTGVALLPASAQASPRPRISNVGSHHDSTIAANKKLVLSFYDELFNKANLDVIDQDTGPTYTQHNPAVADGPEGLRNLVVFLHGLFPNSHNTVQRVIAQGDLVLLQSHAVSVPGTNGLSIVDIFRVANGRIVEHWDNLQAVPDSSVNGHEQFSTLSPPPIADPDPEASTHHSERVVTRFLRSVTTRTPSCRARSLLAYSLYEHDPNIADGAAALTQHYADILRDNPQATFTIARIIAQGDLVAIHSHFQKSPTDLGQSVVDIFRVRHGKIVEHWDGIQDVPATSANDNTMF